MKLRWLAPFVLIACGSDAKDPPPVMEPDAFVPLFTCDEANLATTLKDLPNVVSVQEQNECGQYVMGQARCFRIEFRQPIQHAAPGATFIQQLWLVHRGCDRPTLVADWGYSNDMFFDDELSALYNTNALWVEHRFQGQSIPSDADWDWTALTIKNGADDMHEIVQAFRKHYAQHFVSTGASKGGITATYHHYLHPEDLDGSVPYVAPASRARIDPAYQTYLSTGYPACAQKLRDAQVAAFTTRKPMMIQKLTPLAPGYEQMYLEAMTTSFDWAFWQYYGVQYCSYVPSATTPDQQFFDFFYQFSGIGQGFAPAAGDDDRAWSALYYEWLTEQGFALQIGEHVRSYVEEGETMEAAFQRMQPAVTLPAYNGSLTQEVRTWVRDSAKDLLLIYGQFDPWSGGSMDAPTQATSGRFFVPNATHGAQLMKLPAAERQAALDHVTRMLGVQPVMAMAHLAQGAGANRAQLIQQRELSLILKRRLHR